MQSDVVVEFHKMCVDFFVRVMLESVSLMSTGRGFQARATAFRPSYVYFFISLTKYRS